MLTKPQRQIFDRVKNLVLRHRDLSMPSEARPSSLSLVNNFPAREREFIKRLAEDLHLHLTWDEYDEQDQNIVVWRFSGEPPLTDEQINDDGVVEDGDGVDDEWEDEDDEESRAAVDRVLARYEKAKVMEDDEDGGFDARYESSVKEKMDEWKRGYYKVCQTHSLTNEVNSDCSTVEAGIFV